MPLTFKSELDDSHFNRGLRNMEKNTQSSASKIGDAFSSAGAKLGAALTFGAAIAGIRGLIDYAGDLTDQIEGLGESGERFQQLGGLMSQSGVDAEKYTKALTKLTQSLDDMQSEDGKAREAAEKLGITWDQISKMNGPIDLFMAIADGLKNSTNATESFAAATALMGKGQTGAIGAMRAGSDAISQQAKELAALSDSSRRYLDEVGDKWGEATRKAKAYATEGLAGVLQWMERVAEKEAFLWKNRGVRNAEALYEMSTRAGGVGISAGVGAGLNIPSAGMKDPRAVKAAEEAKKQADKSAMDAAKDDAKKSLDSLKQNEKAMSDLGRAADDAAQAQRDFFVSGLEGAQKLKALETDLALIKERRLMASKEDAADLIKQQSAKELEIAKEKKATLDAFKEQQKQRQEKEQADAIARGERILEVGMMGADGRRDAMREQRREDREASRLARLAKSGTKDARAFSAGLIDRDTSKASVTLLASIWKTMENIDGKLAFPKLG